MAVHGDGKKGRKKGKKGKGDDGQGDLAQPWSVQSVEELGLGSVDAASINVPAPPGMEQRTEGKTVAFSDQPPVVNDAQTLQVEITSLGGN